MQEICVMEFEFAQDYFEPIKNIVRSANPLIASSTIEDIYCLEWYMLRQEGLNLNVLMDNNIFTRVVNLAKGNKIPSTEAKDYRFCCAVMCFFILGNFNIEPNIALYEKTSKNSHSQAIEDLYHFRVADHIHPMGYARLALGLTDEFSNEEIQSAKKIIDGNSRDTKESNYGKLLDDWKLKYLHLLKVTALSKNTFEDTENVRVFLEWITHDCYTSPGSIIFALLFFSPKRRSLPAMIKKINTGNADTLIKGVKNAAWDLTYITKYRKLSKNQLDHTIWFFCSNDNLLKIIARSLYLKEDQKIETAVQSLIKDYWGNKKGSKVYEYYNAMKMAISSDTEARIIHNRKIGLRIDQMISDLESEVRSLVG